ncbi:MAG: HAD family hydrolase [Candidatus Kapabacteria bacterium]|nr:HAD family hydrolase [Ignavibacteriota bacterium]MCW5883624.1 HAD family hydrolase [Candidatus Kapabacteria bacterium]
MKLELITIDFWNTLFDSSNGIKRNAVRQHVFAGEIAKLNVTISQEEFQKAVEASWEFFNNIWMNEQRTPETYETIEYLWNFLKLPHNPDSIRELSKAFAESILDYPPQPNENVETTLKELKKSGYKIGLISDTGFTPGTILRKVIENEGLLGYFDSFSFSDETGVSKPNAKAYTKILNELRIKPELALHIGDIEKTDVKGAKSIGMKAIRFSGDNTAVLNKDNPKVTAADAEIHNWSEFMNVLNKIENN